MPTWLWERKGQLGKGKWSLYNVKRVNVKSHKYTWLVQGTVNHPRAGAWVDGGEVRGRAASQGGILCPNKAPALYPVFSRLCLWEWFLRKHSKVGYMAKPVTPIPASNRAALLLSISWISCQDFIWRKSSMTLKSLKTARMPSNCWMLLSLGIAQSDFSFRCLFWKTSVLSDCLRE